MRNAYTLAILHCCWAQIYRCIIIDEIEYEVEKVSGKDFSEIPNSW